MPSFRILTLCQGICQVDVGSRTLSAREGKAGDARFCREGRERGQLMSHMLHQGEPPPPHIPCPRRISRSHSEVTWLGDTERVS